MLELQGQLSEARAKSARAKSLAEMTKAGHVYIISNIGSFGEHVFKIDHVRVLTRRSLGRTHAKLEEVVVPDFLDYARVPLGDCDACIWCLGVSQASVNEATYIAVTHDYVVAAATALFAANPALRFCFVSGLSADPSEQSRALYKRIKGRTERRLAEFGATVLVFRPGYIRPTASRKPRGFVARYIAPIVALGYGLFVRSFARDFSIGCDELARGLLRVAKHGGDRPLFDNAAIRELARG